MAWHYCHNTKAHGLSVDPIRSQEGKSDHRFWIGTSGRPPKNCNTCRGIDIEKAPATEPVIPVSVTEPIDQLPQEPITEVITNDDGKPNFYPGDCHYCGGHVEKEQGYRFKVNDVWKVKHPACNPSTTGQAPNVPNVPATEPVTATAIDPTTGIREEISRITGEIVDPIVKRNVDRAITLFVQDTLPPMLKQAMKEAEIVRHEFFMEGKVLEIEGTTNKAFPRLMRKLTAGFPGKRINVSLPGPAGSGKSFMAVQAANALGLAIGIISFGPLTDTSKLFGYMDANGKYVRTPFREIWEHGGIMLLDEMDNAHPGLLAELNQALAGDIAAFADGMVPKHPEFRAIATMNTFGRGPDRVYSGRNKLDEATLNRFVTVEIGYDEALETTMAMRWANDSTEPIIRRWLAFVQHVREKALTANDGKPLAYVFSPRNTEHGAMCLANGCDWEEVVEDCLFAAVTVEHRAKLTAGVR